MRRSTVTAARHPRPGKEDVDLTAFVMQQIDIVMSDSHEPSPACPRCGGVDVTNAGFRRWVGGHRMPRFLCPSCELVFDRTLGTPLDSRTRPLATVQLLVPHLSRSLLFSAVWPDIHCSAIDVKNLVVAFRTWLLKLDPSGDWERRIQLGGQLGKVRADAMHFEEAGSREDLSLTYQLTQAFDAIHSRTVRPYPSCAHCDGSEISIYHGGDGYFFPRYQCAVCDRNFSRRTGTVFANTKAKHVDRMRMAIRYLSLPLSYAQVAGELQVDEAWLERWRNMFITLADQLEPDGSLSSRIRLGVKPTRTTPCVLCGRTGTPIKRSIAGWACSHCRRLFSMRRTVVERNGRLEIVDDPVPVDG